MALRFTGLVSTARHFRERLLAGIAPDAREPFLASVRAVLVDVEKTCREHGASTDDLPGPSRNAVAYLREVARTPPDRLPAPGEGGTPTRRIRVNNVVRNLDNFLKVLSQPGLTAERTDKVFADGRRSVEIVEAVCREGGAAPGGLPQQSARAYAMMKWLTSRPNFDRYLGQVQLARAPLESASRILWPDTSRKVGVLFAPGRYLWKARTCAHAHTWHLAVGLLNAGAQDLDDLAEVVVRRPRPAVLARHQAFVDSPDFAEIAQELDLLLGGEQYNPRGRAWDLDALFGRVNAGFFDGGLSRPKLHWQAVSRSCRRFGFYDSVRDAVILNPILDDARLPECVPGFVVFHELLHRRHGFVRVGPRRLAHTPEFLDDERRFPQKEEAERWLDLLARGWGGAPPETDQAGEPSRAEPEASPAV